MSATVAPATTGETQSWQLWNKDVVPFVRDLLFVLAIFAYVIGFAHHAAKMSAFGVDTQLADQPLDSLFNWAAESIQVGWPGFAIILTAVGALLFFAEYLKQRLEHDERCRPIAYGVATASMLLGLVLTFGWSSHEGRCSAARFETGLEPKTSLTMFMNATAHVPILTDNPQAPPPVYILGETNDMYQLLVTQPNSAGSGSALLSIAVPRSLVQSIEFRTFDEGGVAASVAGATGERGLPEGVPTPDSAQSGPLSSSLTPAPHARPAACWLIDRTP
jgi:hypothetical protein